MKPQKPKFGEAYWLDRLIEAGKQIEPEKYTEVYCETVRKAWAGKPLTRLHYTVRKRQIEINETICQ